MIVAYDPSSSEACLHAGSTITCAYILLEVIPDLLISVP